MQFPQLGALWLGIRPKTLSLSLMPILIAASLCWSDGYRLDPIILIAITIAAFSIQIATNLFNDAQDYVNGTDTADRLGPKRITQAGLATAEQTKNAALFFIFIACLAGAFLVKTGGPLILVIGLPCLLAAWGYSNGPYPISRSPFGELFVLTFFGLCAVSASYYLLTGQWSNASFLYGIIIGCPACAVLMVNNYRDLESDQLAGRRTLAILLGNEKIRPLLIVLILIPFILLAFTPKNHVIDFLAFAGLLPASIAIRKLLKLTQKKNLNTVLALTVLSQVLLSFGLSIALVAISG